jgi:Zn-dependent protease
MFDLDVPTLLARMITLLIAFTIHEVAHAVTADYLGDPTAKEMGRITLNPLAHLDPIGTLLLLVAGFGWAKPVPVNPYRLRGNPRTSFALVALAGPVSNILLVGLVAIPYRLGLVELFPFNRGSIIPSLDLLLYSFVLINIVMAVFNMIPIPPLDGSKILMGLLPEQLAYQMRPLETYGPLLLMLLFIAGGGILSAIMRPAITFLFSFLLGSPG